MSRHKFISIAADFFFVDGIALLLTVAIKLKFVTVEDTPVRTAKSLVKHIKLVLQVYDRSGFTVRSKAMPSTKKKSAAMEINLCCETNYFGTATYSSTIDLGFLRTVFPLTLARSGPNIA